jgi:hypothetical protein
MVKTDKIPMRDVVEHNMTGTGLHLTLACGHEVFIPKQADGTATRMHFRLLRGEAALTLPCAACYAAQNLDPT